MRLLDRALLAVVGAVAVAYHVARVWRPVDGERGELELPRLLGKSLADLLPGVRPDLVNPYP